MKLKNLSWLPAIVLMGIIFFFSSKPVNASNQSSMSITNQIVNIYENITNTQYEGEAQTALIEKINHIVRKTAHFCEYAALAMAFALHFYVHNRREKWLFLKPVILSALYAATDEFHQTMVPGRGGQLRDVLLDTAGAATGSLIFLFCTLLLLKRYKAKRAK